VQLILFEVFTAGVSLAWSSWQWIMTWQVAWNECRKSLLKWSFEFLLFFIPIKNN
jgi:hypothetical protein